MIASILCLTRSDIKALHLVDEYSLHRIVYSLFEDTRDQTEKNTSVSSGILYAEKGGDKHVKRILMLSNRSPQMPEHGQLDSKEIDETFYTYNQYGFEVMINPSRRDNKTGKIISLRERDVITHWFIDKSLKSWGFSVDQHKLQVDKIGVKQFHKKGHQVTQGIATLNGVLTVENRDDFVRSFKLGIGRGRAFGCGLLQITPLIDPFQIIKERTHELR